MKIILSPQGADYTTTVSVNGLVVTIDEIDYDLSQIPEGGQADGELPFVGIVTRETITISYQYDCTKAESTQSSNIEDYTFEVTSGNVPCPIKWKEGTDV